MFTLFRPGGGRGFDPPPLHFFDQSSLKATKSGDHGYVNLSYYIGKPPIKVLCPGKFFCSIQGPSKLGWQNILGPRNQDFFSLMSKVWAKVKYHFHLPKKLAQFSTNNGAMAVFVWPPRAFGQLVEIFKLVPRDHFSTNHLNSFFCRPH